MHMYSHFMQGKHDLPNNNDNNKNDNDKISLHSFHEFSSNHDKLHMCKPIASVSVIGKDDKII